MEALKLKREHWEAMRAHVETHVPLEACGLLAGKNDSVEKVLFVTNRAESPVQFRMDPREQLKAFDWIESSGLDLVGIFHSHPEGPDTISATDITESAYPVVHVIWSCPRGEWQARGF